MKKKILVPVTAVILAIAGIGLHMRDNHSMVSLEELSIIKNAAAEATSENTGPGYTQVCTKNTCNETEKFCRCENSHSCTEKLCDH